MKFSFSKNLDKINLLLIILIITFLFYEKADFKLNSISATSDILTNPTTATNDTTYNTFYTIKDLVKNGFHPGDQILEVNEKTFSDTQEALSLILSIPNNKQLKIKVKAKQGTIQKIELP